MVYIICYSVSIFFAYLAQRAKNKDVVLFYSIMSILITSLLGGLRDRRIGTDVGLYGYPDALKAMKSPSLLSFITSGIRGEVGYLCVCYVSANMLGHPNGALFAYQLLTITFVYIGAYRYRKIAPLHMTMALFYAMYCQYSYNAMRQSIAAAIVFAGTYTLRQGRYKKFIMYVLAASLFHVSAIVSLGAIMLMYHITTYSTEQLRNKGIKPVLPYIMIMGVLLLQPTAEYLLRNFRFMKYVGYLNNLNEGNVNKLFSTLVAGPIIMFLLYSRGAKRLFSGSGRYGEDKFFNINAVFLLVFSLAIRFYVVRRILLYSEYVNLIVVAALPHFVKEKRLRVLVTMTVLFVATIFWYRRYCIIPPGGTVPSSETWPYKSILF